MEVFCLDPGSWILDPGSGILDPLVQNATIRGIASARQCRFGATDEMRRCQCLGGVQELITMPIVELALRMFDVRDIRRGPFM
jgi:hypothetical protein